MRAAANVVICDTETGIAILLMLKNKKAHRMQHRTNKKCNAYVTVTV